MVVAADNGVVITDGVDVVDIASAIPVNETIAGATYQAITVNMTVAGIDSDIYDFVEDLSQAFSTGVLKTLSIEIDGAGSNANMKGTIRAPMPSFIDWNPVRMNGEAARLAAT